MLTLTQREELFQAVLGLAPGQSIQLAPPQGLRFSAFRADVFALFQGWDDRKSIRIRNFQNTFLLIEKLGEGLGMSTIVQQATADPSKKLIDEAPEEVHTALQNFFATDEELLNYLSARYSMIEIYAIFLYLMLTKPWKAGLTKEMFNNEQILEDLENEYGLKGES